MSEKKRGPWIDYAVPSAADCDVFICGDPGCGHAHIVGLDERGVAFCEIVMSERQINAALDALHAAEIRGKG